MRLTLLSLTVFLFIASCEHDEQELVPQGDPNEGLRDLCDTSKVYFQNDILPVFLSSCAHSGCHDAGTHMAGLILTSYDNLFKTNVIIPGSPNSSILFKRITETFPNSGMPLDANPLAQENIDEIRQWILDGAENSACQPSAICDTTNFTYSGAILRIVQKKCQGCHQESRPGGGIDLTSYDGIKVIALNGRLENAIRHTDNSKNMPLGIEKLPDCEIEAIRIWTNAGAPNN